MPPLSGLLEFILECPWVRATLREVTASGLAKHWKNQHENSTCISSTISSLWVCCGALRRPLGTDLPESRAYRVQSLRLVSRGSEAKTAMEGMIHIRHIAAAISTNQSWKIGTWKA
jgi:hypothetical protein